MQRPVFLLTKPEVYRYMCELRRTKAPPSRAQRFLEALAFCKGMLGADVQDVLDSSRVSGASKREAMVGTRKKTPLTMGQPAALEVHTA